jgi:hypothetical protein
MGIAEFMIGLAEGRTGGSIDSTADSLGNWIHPLSAGDDEERQLRHCRFFSHLSNGAFACCDHSSPDDGE